MDNKSMNKITENLKQVEKKQNNQRNHYESSMVQQLQLEKWEKSKSVSSARNFVIHSSRSRENINQKLESSAGDQNIGKVNSIEESERWRRRRSGGWWAATSARRCVVCLRCSSIARARAERPSVRPKLLLVLSANIYINVFLVNLYSFCDFYSMWLSMFLVLFFVSENFFAGQRWTGVWTYEWVWFRCFNLLILSSVKV